MNLLWLHLRLNMRQPASSRVCSTSLTLLSEDMLHVAGSCIPIACTVVLYISLQYHGRRHSGGVTMTAHVILCMNVGRMKHTCPFTAVYAESSHWTLDTRHDGYLHAGCHLMLITACDCASLNKVHSFCKATDFPCCFCQHQREDNHERRQCIVARKN